MKNLLNILPMVGLGFFLAAIGFSVISLIIITITLFGFYQPYYYYQYLNIPLFAVISSVAGILALAPLAIQCAFGREKVAKTVEFKTAKEPMAQVLGLRPSHWLIKH